MPETLIARTHAEGLRPLGPASQRNHALISETVASHLSTAHALLFSEPSPTPDGVATDWYAQTVGPVHRLDELGAEEAEAARSRVGTLTRDVLALADELEARGGEADHQLGQALRNAVEVPDGSAIWLVGEQPVLVSWAHSRDIDKAPRGVIRRFVPASPPPPAPAQASIVAVERRPLGNLLWWLAWLLLAVLMFWALYLLIAPCGLRGPALLDLDRCPVADTGPGLLDAEIERRGALEERVAALEHELARYGGACVATPAEPVPELSEALDAVIEEGGEIGTLNIILSWEGTADLDLKVACPSGKVIYFANKQACGGELDVDANLGTPRPNPVENVVFSERPAPGRYQITVKLHSMKQDTDRSRFPFSVRIVVDGRETVRNGVVRRDADTWSTTLDYAVSR